MKHTYLILFAFFFSFSFAQEKKSIHIKRAQIAPKIDGILDDAVWSDAQEAGSFIQFRPDMGIKEKAHQKSIVKVSYTNDAIFVAAYLYDKPENIKKQFTSRDDFGISDFFAVIFNPNNDAQNDQEFFVFASGTQADAAATPSGEDFGWNAVWDSAVKIVDDGWIVEIEIPYSALRFSNKNIETWGIQFHRLFREDNSQYTWNPVDISKGNIGLYHGELLGLKDIEPPTRLSFYPFASAAVASFDGKTSDDYRIGLDLKYGLSENFTLDATLIPDFSQVAFDDVELNLGPFEQQFSEQRQFFTEGVDLFNKGRLFYSRRIGNAPIGSPTLTNDEEITDAPRQVKMLNAVKISGRTKKGLGIGFFNAITEKTEATVKNTVTEATRKEVIEPFANYNILVLDQQFNKNSSISLINTNVTREGHFRDANVTGLLFDLTNKKNTYNIDGQAKFSSLNLQEGAQNGFSSRLSFAKVSGNYQFRIGHRLVDTKYNINDLGIQRRNNYNRFYAFGTYRIFKPTKKLNALRISFRASYNRLFEPSTYTGNDVGVRVFAQNKKLFAVGGRIEANIGKQYDYFEARTTGRFYIYENYVNSDVWFSSNYNKPFALDGNIGFATLFEDGRDYANHWFGLSPRFKFNDKFLLTYSFEFDLEDKSRGYVTNTTNDIIFGQRKQKVIENSISGNYNFNSFHGLTLTFRNYWATVAYEKDFYSLQDDGRLTNQTGYTIDNIGYNPDVNFNTWNLDFKYEWQFAPGSQLVALYRNQLFNRDTTASDSYFDSLNTLFKKPMQNIFSLRFIYYIDYNNLKNSFKKKVS